MAPNQSFSLAFRPGRRALTYDSRASGKQGSTPTGIAKNLGPQGKDSKTARQDFRRVLKNALEDTSSLNAMDDTIKGEAQCSGNPHDEDQGKARAVEMVMAFRPKSHNKANTSKVEIAGDHTEAAKVHQQQARNREAKVKHETNEVLSMLSGFKMKKTKRMRHVRSAGIKKRAQFKTSGIDYAKIQRQGKVLIKTSQDKVLPASEFWRSGLDSAKDKEAYIAKAVSAAMHLQPSRIKVHSTAARRRAEQAAQRSEGGDLDEID